MNYFYKENLDRFIGCTDNIEYRYRYHAGFEIDQNLNVQYPPDIVDLVRMHQLVRKRRAMTVLEFGVGYSTLVYADAIKKNEKDFKELPEKKTKYLVWQNQFEVHSIDASPKWISNFKRILTKHPDISNYIHLHTSKIHIGTFEGQICHYYDSIPDIVPDFIYLDGPSAGDVRGTLHGMSFKQLDRTVMAGDILKLESILHPGTFILVDGRKNNARFLANNFKRKWVIDDKERELQTIVDIDWLEFEHWNEFDYTTMELTEFPTNFWNYKKILLTNGQGKLPLEYRSFYPEK